MSSVPETTLTLYQARGDAGVDSVLLDPSPEVEAVQNGERLSRGRAADLLGIRRSELDELADAGLLVLRRDANTGKSYIRASDFRRFVKNLEPVEFIEVGVEQEAEQEEDWTDDDESEAAPARKAKAAPAAKPAPAVPVVEEQEVEGESEAGFSDEITLSGPASALSAFLRRLFGEQAEGEQVEEEAEPEPVKQTKANPLFGLGKSRKSRRSGR